MPFQLRMENDLLAGLPVLDIALQIPSYYSMHRMRRYPSSSFRRDHLASSRTYEHDRRICHNFNVRCKYCHDWSWPSYAYHRKSTDTYDYYCEACWQWWHNAIFEFRLCTLANTLPDWVPGNESLGYKVYLVTIFSPEQLRKRKRHRYLYLLLSTSGRLEKLQDMMSPSSVQWDCKSLFINRIIAMMVHGLHYS